MQKSQKMEDSYGSLKEVFKNPPNEFRMMPFWFWNHEMVEKEVERQIRDHREHGIGGEFIHPRHGRLTPYMGKRWLENVEHAADIGKELGMPMFLYDEDNWPSGPAGGKITGPEHPENRGKFIILFDELDIEGGKTLKEKIEYKRLGTETEIFAAIAIPEPENFPSFAKEIDKQIDVTSSIKGDTIIWDAPKGNDWLVVIFCMGVNPPDANMNGYIDILRKETIQDFIRETHKKYADWFISKGKEDYLGTIVPGIFTDEPTMSSINLPGGYIMEFFTFTPEMPKKFQEMFGYNFNETLISQFHDTGDIGVKHRCDQWLCRTEMYVESFFKQIYDFCEKYNWRSTGHVLVEGVFPSQIFSQGDYFKVFKYMHYGGVDQLTEDFRPDDIEKFWNIEKNPYTGMKQDMILASKFASSAAHLLGKPRVLVEAFGTSSWKITLASAKRVNDYLIATGCDLFVPHDFAYSEDGYRKQDHPASFNYQPYYKYWGKLCDHNARLCSVLNANEGILHTDVLLYYPTRTFYAEMRPRTSNEAEMVGMTFTHNGDCLFRQQIDFELANDEIILEGKLEKSHIKINKSSFKVFFLGATTTLDLKLAKYLKEFYDKGGKILATQYLPYKEANTGKNKELESIIKHIFGIAPRSYHQEIAKIPLTECDLFENNNENGGIAIFIKTPLNYPFISNYFPMVELAMEKLLPFDERDIIILKEGNLPMGKTPGYIMCKHKINNNKDFYFLANTSRNAVYKNVEITLNSKVNNLELWDTYSGKILRFSDYSIENDKTKIKMDFKPYESYLFVSSNDPTIKDDNSKIDDYENTSFEKPIKIEEITGDWDIQLYDENVAMLYQKWNSRYDVQAGKAWGYTSIRKFTHNFNVENLEDLGKVRLVIEGLVGDYGWCKTTNDPLRGEDSAHFTMPKEVSIYVNDKLIRFNFDFNYEWMDACWIVGEITHALQEGENEVKFVCRTGNHNTFHVVTDPWRIIGKFNVDDQEGIPLLKPAEGKVALKDLAEQGYERYHGGFGYKKNVKIPEFTTENKLILNILDTKDCVEIKINGNLVNVCWCNWKTDITEYIKAGETIDLELVYYGIAQNMMQTNTFETGLRGKVQFELF